MRSALLFAIFICIHTASTESFKSNGSKLETVSDIQYNSLLVNVTSQEDIVKLDVTIKPRHANESTRIIEATGPTTIKNLTNSSICHISITGENSEEQVANETYFVDQLTDIDGRATRVKRENINECARSRPPCDGNATCHDTLTSYNCICNHGYTGSGWACTDSNECARSPPPCDGNATCHNTLTSYSCTCKDGFSGNGWTCTDINECIPYPCERFNRSFCENLINDSSCSCKEGFTGDGDNLCGSVDGLRLTGRSEETTRDQGYVEILARPDGDWRTICHPGWKKEESRVVCNMLGYKRVSFLLVTVDIKTRKTTETWLDKVECTSAATHLQNCTLGIFGNTSCNTTSRVKVRCSNTTVQNDTAELQYETLNGTIYDFVCKWWEANRLTRSLQTCGIEGRAASIECRKKTYSDRSLDMDFDHSTLREFRCNTSTEQLLEEIPFDGNVNGILAATILGDLSAISDNSTSSTFNDGNTTQMAQIINKLYAGLNKTGSNVGKSAAFYLVWSTDNFHRILGDVNSTRNNDNADSFDNMEKLKFVISLNGIATRLELHDRNVTIETDAVIFKSQALNDTNKTRVEFQGYTGEGREKVQASLSPPSPLNSDEAKPIYSNFYLYRDSTLFPPVKENDTKVDEVLSVQHHGGDLAENSTQEINVTFPRDMNEKIKKSTEPGKLHFRRCGYLNSNTGNWERDMCTTIIMTQNATKCKCTRTKRIIGFSVLVKVRFALQAYWR